jgi:hypothetical protein
LTGYILLTHDLFGVIMAGLAGSFLSEFAEVVKEWLEANSMVYMPPEAIEPDPQPAPKETNRNYHEIERDYGHGITSGDRLLDVFYKYQFVQNEPIYVLEKVNSNTLSFKSFEHMPLLPGTVTGTIYNLDLPIYTFTINDEGIATFSKIGNPANTIAAGWMDHSVGNLFVSFNEEIKQPIVPDIKAVVSYEYNME